MTMKKLSEFEMNKENPFLSEALEVINKNIVQKTKMASNTGERAILKAIDESTGEILGHTAFIRQIEVDEEKFTKFYLSGFQAFYDLRPSSLKTFGFILNQLKPNRDDFDFYAEDCMEKYKMSRKTVERALTELLNNGVIARGRNEYQYFVNPMVVFNGNRVTFAKTYVKKREKAKKLDNTNQLQLFPTQESAFESFENEGKAEFLV